MRVLEHVGERRNVRGVEVFAVSVEHPPNTPIGQGGETFPDPWVGVDRATGPERS